MKLMKYLGLRNDMVTVEEFKNALGETGKKMSEEEIVKLMSVFDYLTSYWLEQREIEIFCRPIKELLDQ